MNAVETKKDAIKVVIVEDYKLTRVGLRSALNEYEHIGGASAPRL